MSKLSILKEFWDFSRLHKKWWLAPIIITLLLLGALMCVAQNQSLAPLIYAVF